MIRTERRGETAIVTFDRGERLNAFNQALIQGLTRAAGELENDHSIQSIVLAGTLQTARSARNKFLGKD